MRQNPPKEPQRLTLAHLQVVLIGLLGGSGMFLVLAVYMVASGGLGENGEDLAVLVPVAVAVAVAAAIAQVLIAPLLGRARGRAEGGPEAGADGLRQNLWQRLVTLTIVRAAVLEGAAFFNLVVYMTTQSLVPLALAVALMLGIAARIPTRSWTDRWLDEQIELARQQAQFGR